MTEISLTDKDWSFMPTVNNSFDYSETSLNEIFLYEDNFALKHRTSNFELDLVRPVQPKNISLTASSKYTELFYTLDKQKALSMSYKKQNADTQKIDCYTFDKKEYYRIDRYETKFKNKMHTKTEVREELVDVLDENGQTVWENIIHAQPVYTLVDHGTHKAALVSCKVI